MAAVLIVGVVLFKQKIEERKERKRQKKALDDERYAALQDETRSWNAQQASKQKTRSRESLTRRDSSIERSRDRRRPSDAEKTSIRSISRGRDGGNVSTDVHKPSNPQRTESGTLIDI